MEGSTDFPGRSQLLRAAFAFARSAHGGQRLETDGAPFIHHPLAVGALLHEEGFPDEVAAAGLLHDTVEDSDTTVEDLRERFGPMVADLVAAVTEPADVPTYPERKGLHRRQVEAAGRNAAAVFAADKLVSARNLRGALACRGEAAVSATLKQPLESKLDHYAATARELRRFVPPLPFLAPLREELDRLSVQRVRERGAVVSDGDARVGRATA